MKRLMCWWNGHVYVLGLVRYTEAVVRRTGPYYLACICLRCGSHDLQLEPSDPS